MVELEKVVSRLVEKTERRYFGKYRARVVDNADPERRGRLKLRVQSLLGPDVVTGWALPCVPYGGASGQGLLLVPEVGAAAWAEFEEGDLEFPVWTGVYWAKPGGEAETPRPNDPDGAEQDEVQDPPTRKILKTLKGHTLQIEDADDAESITVVEATHGHVIRLDADGIAVTDGANGHELVMDADGVRIVDAAGNSLVMTGDAVTLTAAVPLTIDASGQAVVVKGSTVDFQKA